MAQATKIEWTEQSWNFLRGCRRVSEGCTNCYAERQAIRHAGPGGPYEGLVRSTPNGPRWTGEISFHEDILLAPLRRKKPTTYFVNSMSDLFYESVKDEWLDKAFAVMALTPQHTYQCLTKRPGRMLNYFAYPDERWSRILWLATTMGKLSVGIAARFGLDGADSLDNVWLGISCEDQKTADERIPLLLQTPAAVRWISAEPLLGPIDIAEPLNGYPIAVRNNECTGAWDWERTHPPINWVVTGGESGPGARPCDIAWIRSIVGQCKAASVPVFVKQLGAKPFLPGNQTDITRLYLKDRKGGDMLEWPGDLQVREFPQ